tara:strand:+ start:564 stop:737 length:174 start_codon:yes stop_codon:yes gene_type:complete
MKTFFKYLFLVLGFILVLGTMGAYDMDDNYSTGLAIGLTSIGFWLLVASAILFRVDE